MLGAATIAIRKHCLWLKLLWKP